MWKLVTSDLWLNTRVIAEVLNLDRGAPRNILTEDLEIKKIALFWLKTIIKISPSALFTRFGTLLLLPFPKNKNCYKRLQLSDVSDIQRYLIRIPKRIPEDEFQNCFEWLAAFSRGKLDHPPYSTNLDLFQKLKQ